MERKLPLMKHTDWSMNLEDPYYVQHPDEMLKEAVQAVIDTAPAYYVNLVTPGDLGHPADSFLADLAAALQASGTPIREIRYIDECGCGGHVTRVFR